MGVYRAIIIIIVVVILGVEVYKTEWERVSVSQHSRKESLAQSVSEKSQEGGTTHKIEWTKENICARH